MPKFFCSERIDDRFVIRGEDAKHIGRVLRMKSGDSLCIGGNDGYDYQTEIESIQDQEIILSIVGRELNQSEPGVQITLYQALPKGDKFDFIVQKAVELGVHTIVPVLSKRCVSRPDEKAVRKKIDRWQKIAEQAAKQSGRGMIPKVSQMLAFEDAVREMTDQHENALLCYEGGGKRLNELVSSGVQTIGLMIGSEGGFEPEEVEYAQKEGVQIATLGKLILRCETAPITALSILLHITQNI
jgi:16S rRNA (uracil1498-N3)-methyltransferase